MQRDHETFEFRGKETIRKKNLTSFAEFREKNVLSHLELPGG